ncbi:hypothetical protein BJ742DRAFT_822822 [Cladochytrium replicatum]|nr:hypothetical protein BJ742DRAFT_822822 [Cladochytrium replicatum]
MSTQSTPAQQLIPANASSPGAGALLAVAEELERELRALLRSARSPFDKDIGNLRARLRDIFEQIFFAEFDLALAKDVEASMWKVTHYKLIEEFRRRHKALQASVKARGAKPIASEDKRELRALTASFRAFLSESTSFYLNFIHKIASFFRLRRVYLVVLSKLEISPLTFNEKYTLELTPHVFNRATQVCHRCLIFLGDLARYRELHADRKEKDWSSSRMFYTLALHLIPDNGNPFNQFAVIDTYEGDRLGAVERYIRSLAIPHAFPTALENLVLLFQKARRPADGIGSDEPRTEKTLDYQFISNFIVLHWSFVGKERDILAFTEASSSLITNLREIYSTNPPSDIVLSRLLLVTTGALHLSRSGALEKLSPGPVNGTRDELESAMVRFICSIFSTILDDVNVKLDSGEDFVTLPTLALRIGLRWLYARESADDEDIFQFSEMWPKLDELNDRVYQFVRSRNQPLLEEEGLRGRITTEDLELRGFLPFHVPGEESDELSNSEALEVVDGSYGRHVGDISLSLLRAGVILEIGTKLRRRKQSTTIPLTSPAKHLEASPRWKESLPSVHNSLDSTYIRQDSAIGQSVLSTSHEIQTAPRPIGAERLSKPQSGVASVDNLGGIFGQGLFDQFSASNDGSSAPIDSDAVNTIGFLGLESRGLSNGSYGAELPSSFTRRMQFSKDLLNGGLNIAPFTFKGTPYSSSPNLALGSENPIGVSPHWPWNVQPSSPWLHDTEMSTTFDPNSNNSIDSRLVQPSVEHTVPMMSQRYRRINRMSDSTALFGQSNFNGGTSTASIFPDSFSHNLNTTDPRPHFASETPYTRSTEGNSLMNEEIQNSLGSDGRNMAYFQGRVTVWQ